MKLKEIELIESLVELAEQERPQLAERVKGILCRYKARFENRKQAREKQTGLKQQLMDILNRDGRSRTVSQLMDDYQKEKGIKIQYQSVYQALTYLKTDGLVKHNQFVHPAVWKTRQTLKGDMYSKKLRFAQEMGYKSVADAMAVMGITGFNQQFKKVVS